MRHYSEIIIAPVVTEKSMALRSENVYTFKVAKDATKTEIKKAIEDAKKNMIEVPIVNTTIPHEIIGEAGAGRVLLKPASEGTGVIAGGAVRPILELAGIKDIRTKCLRSNNPGNVVNATMNALKSLKTAEEVATLRGKKVEEL